MERYKRIVFVNFIIFILLSNPLNVYAQGKVQTAFLTIKDLKITDEGEKLRLEVYSNKPLRDYKAFTLNSPPRIVLDIPQAKYKGPTPKKMASLELPPIKRVRIGIYPQKVRLVVDLSSQGIPSYSIVKNKTQLSIEIDKKIVKLLDGQALLGKDKADLDKGKLPLQKPLEPSGANISINTKGMMEQIPIEEERKPSTLLEAKEKVLPQEEEKPLTDLEAKAKTPAREKEVEKEGALSKDRDLKWKKGDITLDLKGYYKNIALGSKTVDSDKYFLNLNRFRLDLTGSYKDILVLKMVYDHEGLLGDYLRSDEFRRIKSFEGHDLSDLDWKIIDQKDFYWHHSLYRAYLRFQSEKFNLSIGRQRIAWGTGKFWNPTDIFNPFNPLQIERDERVGVDSVDAEFFFRPMTSINLVYAPQDSSSRSKGALKFKNTYENWDFSLSGGKSLKDKIIGGDFATTIFEGGFRGETLYHFVPHGKDYFQFVLNYDYTFKNSFYVLVEYFYNSGPLSKSEFLQLIDRGTSTLTRHLVGANFGYDITPLLRGDLYMIYGLKNEGLFVHPKLRYSVSQNLEVVGGVQWFNQRKGSEFEFDHNLYFVYVQYYF